MYATTDTRTSMSPSAGIPVQTLPMSVVDATSTCGCGQDLDSRHSRCTRCGR